MGTGIKGTKFVGLGMKVMGLVVDGDISCLVSVQLSKIP